ncbi:hypothetical protein ACDL92_00465 [Ihubacter sp. mB4P-1]|uniref:hypothetical protein n=1 Tax=Ihubacter sp. mB4P-1 TaxID=3242370 RepID=UPI00137B2055
MGVFLDLVEEELKEQRKLRQQSEKALARAPAGYLKNRPRKSRIAFYACKNNNGKSYAENISQNSQQIEKLAQKKLQLQILRMAEINIAALETLQKIYQENQYLDIIESVPQTYRDAFQYLAVDKLKAAQSGKPIQLNFDEKYHIHEAVCGLLVRSKSEVIIVNTLVKYNIPFLYEKRFPYPNARGYYFEPDFTFELPTGEIIIWEHLGLLKNEDYSIRTGEKLMTYQKHGFLIGRNLILTQDDEKGNCSSGYIDEIVRTQLLPYFR